MENQHRLWVTALLGCLVFVVLLFLLDLPAQIKRGVSGHAAIQALDTMRRPFLEIKEIETRLIKTGGGGGTAARNLTAAIESTDKQLAEFRALAAYNAELSARVQELFHAYERWIGLERHMVDHVRELTRTHGAAAAAKHLAEHLPDSASGFLATLNRLGDSEGPIHEDIERGEHADTLIAALSGLLFAYLIGLIIWQQHHKARVLQKNNAELGALRTHLEKRTADLVAANTRLQREIGERQRAETAALQKSAFVQLLQAITAAVNDAASAEEAIQTALDRVCEHTGWPVGHAYLLDAKKTGELVSMTLWHLDDPERFVAFRQMTENTRFSSGKGLPGRVFQNKVPLWIGDVTVDTNFPRAGAARACGIRTGFAFPVMIGTNVVAVLEFFSTNTIEPNQALLDVMGQIGMQLGHIIERQRAEDRLQHLAHHDHLTGLPNRVLITDRLGQALARARYHKRAAAVFCLDLDRFSVINDTLGQETGDLLLKAVAQRLMGVVRDDDTVARLGGDEFAILLVDMASQHDAPRIAQTVLEVLGRPFVIDGRELFITSSIGISLYPGDGDDTPTLMKRADIAMRRAKDRGKNSFHLYSPAMDAQASKRLTLETQLRRAVEREEFILHYQPKLSLNTGRISGMEALMRWQHPELGLVPPADFIPLLEETGLIVPVGEWALHSACAQNLAWQRAGLPPMRVAVNLSTLQFKCQNMAKVVAQVLQRTGLEPKWLELEITESILAEQEEMVAAVLNELDAMDVRIAIDDFGTGYSSLSYLKRFPIRVLKIDRSFVRDLTTDSDDAAITSAVIAMAHSLKIPTIAEGVETAEQMAYLHAHGCNEIQGYYFSRPLPAEEFERLLKENPRPLKSGGPPPPPRWLNTPRCVPDIAARYRHRTASSSNAADQRLSVAARRVAAGETRRIVLKPARDFRPRKRKCCCRNWRDCAEKNKAAGERPPFSDTNFIVVLVFYFCFFWPTAFRLTGIPCLPFVRRDIVSCWHRHWTHHPMNPAKTTR